MCCDSIVKYKMLEICQAFCSKNSGMNNREERLLNADSANNDIL